MENNKFMPDATAQERLNVLQNTAASVREDSYDSPLTEDEILNRKDEYFANDGKIKDLETEKKELVADLTQKIKEIKSLNAGLRSEIREGSVKRDGLLYDLADYGASMMLTYDAAGDLVGSRRLTPAEKNGQSRMFIPGNMNTGTHD